MLTAYRMTTESGYTWETNMAEGVTLDDAAEYFMGSRVNIGEFPEEIMEEVVKVEELIENERN